MSNPVKSDSFSTIHLRSVNTLILALFPWNHKWHFLWNPLKSIPLDHWSLRTIFVKCLPLKHYGTSFKVQLSDPLSVGPFGQIFPVNLIPLNWQAPLGNFFSIFSWNLPAQTISFETLSILLERQNVDFSAAPLDKNFREIDSFESAKHWPPLATLFHSPSWMTFITVRT